MLAEERQDLIRRELAGNGRVLATELAGRFGVSEDTVRRDLRDLAEAGLCRRVHGGALALAPFPHPIAERGRQAVDEKARLARATASLVKSGQTLFIDAGSTNIAIAAALPRDAALTVVTNAPAVALALTDHPRARVLMLGGMFVQESGAVLGVEALREIERIRADAFLLGGCGVDARLGVTAFDPAEADAKRAMVAQSESIIVAATADKLATAAPFRVARPGELHHLVVAPGADPALLDHFRDAGTTVHRAT